MNKGIYKDNKGRWYIHTTIKGKTCTIRGYATKREAEENYTFAIEKWKREHNVFDVADTYECVLEDYYVYRSKLVRQESLRKDKTQLNGYFHALFAGDVIKNIFVKKRLEIIYSNIVSNDNFSDEKKSRLIIVFKEFAKYCHMVRLISEDVYKDFLMVFLPIKVSRQPNKSKRYIPQSHINAILNEINKVNDNLFYLAFSVAYSSGLRISELLGLYWEDIDLENKKIKVQRQLLTNGTITTTLKTSNSYREIPISQIVYNRLKSLVLSGNRLFNYSHTTFKRKLAYYEKQAGVPNYSAHELRHTFCTNLASKVTNISEVTYCAKVSGHTVSMFLNTYCRSLDKELEGKFFN